MYLQDIVISPDIFEKISRAFSLDSDEYLDLKSYNENLNLKKILFDKNESEESKINNKIQEIINSSSDFGKKIIESILRNFEKSEKIEFKEIKNCKKYAKDILTNQVLNLSALSESKIVNSEDKSFLLLKLNNSELSELEILNFEEFIKPKSNSKIFSLEKEINIKRGEKFNYEDYFKPYLCETKSIKIVDKYLRKREGGFLNLMKLLKNCKKLEKIEIHTIKKDNLEKYKTDITVDEVENEIKKLFPTLRINTYSTGDHIRFLETEDFKIVLDPGFDFVNKDYKAEKHDVIINFKKIYNN